MFTITRIVFEKIFFPNYKHLEVHGPFLVPFIQLREFLTRCFILYRHYLVYTQNNAGNVEIYKRYKALNITIC